MNYIELLDVKDVIFKKYNGLLLKSELVDWKIVLKYTQCNMKI